MYTREEIIDNDILACPKHGEGPPKELGICKECDEIVAVWADYFMQFSKDCAEGKVPPLKVQWCDSHGDAGSK